MPHTTMLQPASYTEPGDSQTAIAKTISVIVPVYRATESLPLCLAALTSATPPPQEIILVLDGEPEEAYVSIQTQGIRTVALPERRGPAHARNVGARLARGEILFFVDADVIVHRDALARLAEAFAESPSPAAVFGSYDDNPAAQNLLSQYRNLLHHYVHQTGAREASTFWAGCGAVRREAFFSVGGFDEHYRQASIEDIELGYRLKAAGQRIILDRALQGCHLKRWGVRSLLHTDIFRRALPWTQLIMRVGMVNDLNLKTSGRASAATSWLLVGAILGAFVWPPLLLAAVCFLSVLVLLNAEFYRFLMRHRGIWFFLRALPWHILYFLYSSLAFAFGAILYYWTGIWRNLRSIAADNL
jgi:GT2 family glycosyltransferase